MPEDSPASSDESGTDKAQPPPAEDLARPLPAGPLSFATLNTGDDVIRVPFPFAYDHSADIAQAHFASARRNMAAIQSGAVTPISPLPVSPDPIAGTAPASERTTIALEGRTQAVSGGRANPRVTGNDGTLRVETVDRARVVTIEQNLRTNLGDSRRAAHVLLDATRATITDLQDKRLNDPGAADLIEFLDWLANGLADLIDNLDRAIADPASEPMFLGTAGVMAESLHRGLLEFVEQKRVQIVRYGALTGVAWFLSYVTGTDLTEILKLLVAKK
jgi:hypothetical protein